MACRRLQLYVAVVAYSLILIYATRWYIQKYPFSSNLYSASNSNGNAMVSGGGDDNDDDNVNVLSNYEIIPVHQVGEATDRYYIVNTSTIVHQPLKSLITVHLAFDSRQNHCRRPSLIGRLSGPSLLKINWNYGQEESASGGYHETSRSIIGSYEASVSGEYRLEIIMELCERLDTRDVHRNWSSDCILTNRHEDGVLLLLAHPTEAIVHVPTAAVKGSLQGYWKRNSSISTEHVGMLTRHQPVGCRHNESTMCLKLTDLTRFDSYQWTWNPGNEPLAKQLVSSHRLLQTPRKLLMIGDSHSYYMSRAMLEIIETLELSIDIKFWRLPFPSQVLKHITKSGTRFDDFDWVFVALGQWPASFKAGQPFTFTEYSDSLRSLFNHLKYQSGANIILRTIHYNPLGDKRLTCPPEDWRNPSVIDGYNLVLAELSTTMSIPLLNTKFVMDNVWDSARDFCHYKRETNAAYEESRWLLDQLLRMIKV